MSKHQMRGLKTGKFVWIPCEAKQGMFPTERYIHIEVQDAKPVISGFIMNEDVRKIKEDKKRAGRLESEARAIIAQLTKDSAALLFRGEILSATNPVRVTTKWLDSAAYAIE